MKTHLKLILILATWLSLLGSCRNEPDIYIGLRPAPPASSLTTGKDLSPIAVRHKDSFLKILAIGNSFTNHGSHYMPWFIDYLNGDSICFAKLTYDGCSLNMHWTFHRKNSPVYKLMYSDCGDWVESDITTIDDALTVLDWDIIVIQQVSGLAGDYSTFQPALEYLVMLFRESNPNVKVAWHYTWAYKAGTVHPEFKRYGYDPKRMYDAIHEAGDLAVEEEGLDLRILSADLIRKMREQYPEVEDGFSTDGFHLNSGLAYFAVSTLWYESLVAPIAGTTGINLDSYPIYEYKEQMEKANTIITDILIND